MPRCIGNFASSSAVDVDSDELGPLQQIRAPSSVPADIFSHGLVGFAGSTKRGTRVFARFRDRFSDRS